MTGLTTTLSRDTEGHPVLEVAGDVDLMSADALVAAALDLPRENGDANHRLDLSGVTFIDSTGVGALIRIRNDALKQGRRVRLVAVSRHVVRTLEITGLGDTFGADRDGSG